MAKRFEIPAIPKGEVARYTDNPFQVVSESWQTGQKNGVMVRPDDDFLVQRGGHQAFNVYQRLLQDDTVQASITKLSQEITVRPWKLEAVSDSPGDLGIKEYVEQALGELKIDSVYRAMLEAYVVGFSVVEIMWRRTPRGVVPFDLRFRDQRRFKFESDEDADFGFTMKMIDRESMSDGIKLPARKFIAFRYWSQYNGDPYGCGLGRVLYPLVKFKRRALESQLLYSDRFANPTAVAKAPLSATAAEVETLYAHLSNLSQETALVMPEGFELEFINPGGTPETFEKLRDSLIRDITLLIAGENEAGQATAGSLASSEVADSVRLARANELAEMISDELSTTLIRWIVDLNFGSNVSAPKIFRDFTSQEEVKLTMSDVATLVKDIGLAPTKDWITERFNVELEEDSFKVPEGPPGTSGVDVGAAAEEGPGDFGLEDALGTENDDEIGLDEALEGSQGRENIKTEEEPNDPQQPEAASGDDSGAENKRLKSILKGLIG